MNKWIEAVTHGYGALRTSPKARHVRTLLRIALTVLVVFSAAYLALAIHFWLPWPPFVRTVLSWGLLPLVLCLWFWRGSGRRTRRAGALLILTGFLSAYMLKTPVTQDWVPLMEHEAYITREGDLITIHNFRDTVHETGKPPRIRWTQARFDLSQIEGADLIIQPFGGVKALAHVMLTFRFADGRHVIVSMEARQAKGREFDALAGFFRRDPVYPIVASERDLIWERLARTPPDPVQIYSLRADKAAVRIYFERIVGFVNRSHQKPIFYSTLSESCMTTFMNLAPEAFADVPWYDGRRWVPGYSLSLFQQLGLVDQSLPPEALAQRQTLPEKTLGPDAYASDAQWSHAIRQSLPAASPAADRQ